MRNIKTGISVFICILICILFKRDTYVVSAITAVFTLREDVQTTLIYGKHRVGGNVIGAFFSLIVITVFKLFGETNLVQLICIPLTIVLLIAVLSKFGLQEGTVGGCATLLTILFMIPDTQSYSYAFSRIVDSFIGMFVALAINYILPNRQLAKMACQEDMNKIEKDSEFRR